MYTKEQLDIKEILDELFEIKTGFGFLSNPKVEFILKKDEKFLFGLRDYSDKLTHNYVGELNGENGILHELKSREDLEENETELHCRLEAAMLYHLMEGYDILDVRIKFHFHMWDFFDEFYDSLIDFDDAMRVYMGYCLNHGITEKFIESNSMIVTADYFSLFPPRMVQNGIVYSPIMKRRIDDEELCLSCLGPLKTAEDFRVGFIVDGIFSDIKSFKTFKDASTTYMKIYKIMTIEGEKASKETIEFMQDFIEKDELNHESCS